MLYCLSNFDDPLPDPSLNSIASGHLLCLFLRSRVIEVGVVENS